MSNHASVLLVAVGLVLATVGGGVLWSVHRCETTESITVQPVDSNPADDPVQFSSLFERQQDAFRRALEDGRATVHEDLDIPYKVFYENERYAVYRAHSDGCWILAIPAFPVALLGVALTGYGGHRYRQE